MKKIWMTLLMSGFCGLVAMDAAIWEHDFHAGKSIRKIEDVETVFDIRRERSVDPVELLPEGAEADIWYPIVRNITLDLRAIRDAEEVTGLVFAQPVCELSFTLVDGEKSIHGHYRDPYKTKSGFPPKTVTRHKCYECEGTLIIMRLLRRDADSGDIAIVKESHIDTRHSKGRDLQDFTNPASQGLTPAPEGVGGVNKQVFENTIKRWFS